MLGRLFDVSLALPRLLVGARRFTMPRGFRRDLVLREEDFESRATVGGHAPVQGFVQQLRALELALEQRLGPAGSVAVCSPRPREGRSLVAVDLAITLAHDRGRPVVLLDLDLGHPTLHKLLDVDGSPGFTDLQPGARVETLLTPTGVPGLELVPAGTPAVDSARLLQSGRLEALLQQLRARGAFVIVDTPAAVGAVDARVIAERVDGVVTVVRLGRTRRSDLAPYYRAFAGLPLLGVAANHHEQWIPRWLQRFL